MPHEDWRTRREGADRCTGGRELGRSHWTCRMDYTCCSDRFVLADFRSGSHAPSRRSSPRVGVALASVIGIAVGACGARPSPREIDAPDVAARWIQCDGDLCCGSNGGGVWCAGTALDGLLGPPEVCVWPPTHMPGAWSSQSILVGGGRVCVWDDGDEQCWGSQTAYGDPGVPAAMDRVDSSQACFGEGFGVWMDEMGSVHATGDTAARVFPTATPGPFWNTVSVTCDGRPCSASSVVCEGASACMVSEGVGYCSGAHGSVVERALGWGGATPRVGVEHILLSSELVCFIGATTRCSGQFAGASVEVALLSLLPGREPRGVMASASVLCAEPGDGAWRCIARSDGEAALARFAEEALRAGETVGLASTGVCAVGDGQPRCLWTHGPTCRD